MERSEPAHKPARAPPAARGRTGMPRHTRHADAVEGRQGERRCVDLADGESVIADVGTRVYLRGAVEGTIEIDTP